MKVQHLLAPFLALALTLEGAHHAAAARIGIVDSTSHLHLARDAFQINRGPDLHPDNPSQQSTSQQSKTMEGEGDRVVSIPGYKGDPLCFESYSGYLPTTTDKSLFYWYHEATAAAGSKPLVLWINGGPGCSSLGGMFTEHGPFVVDQDLSVTLNPYSWNTVANMLYLEQPAGVGFSYPNVPANDTMTASDTVDALEQFLQRFPALTTVDFYVAGESYGGHYVPNIVKEIRNRGGVLASNLKGFAVGNGYTDWQLDFNANVHYGVGHALTSREDYEAADQACEGDFARCFWPRPDVECPLECGKAVSAATVGAMDGSIDIYDIYENVCLETGQERAATEEFVLMEHRQSALQGLRASRGGSQVADEELLGGTVISPIFPTCIDTFSAKYLNLPEVQAAIHVRPGTVTNGTWSDCGNVKYDFNFESELPNYKEWTAEAPSGEGGEGEGQKKMDILIYSGDADFIVNFMGSENWITSLKLPVKNGWQKWRGGDRQVAGFYIEYEGLTFLTVKGAGHMVPKDRPLHALNMITSFLTGTPFNSVPPVKQQPPLCAHKAS